MDSPPPIGPVTLEGDLVRLEPLSIEHLPGLTAVGLDPRIWTWMPARVTTPEGLARWLEDALGLADAGLEVPFATIERASGRVVGSTRYHSLALAHRRLEIGWTWLAPPWQGTGLNTEAKLLQLGHAFEVLGCRRVEFKTDSRNDQSRAAIEKIGARFEGIFRKHMIMADGRQRDTAYYSIIDDEWPEVRDRLTASLARRRSEMPSPASARPTAGRTPGADES